MATEETEIGATTAMVMVDAATTATAADGKSMTAAAAPKVPEE